jgi:hypothetical protein
MKQFAIKSGSVEPSMLELLDEVGAGYRVRIVMKKDDWDDVKEEFMSKELFDTCLRTGYITAVSA